jgi:hypothetical protein
MSTLGNQLFEIAQKNPDIRIADEPAAVPRGRTEAHRQLDAETGSEHAEQVALFRWADDNVHRRPALALMFAFPNGGHRHAAVAAKLKQEGVKAGVPDIFLPYPNAAGKGGLFIEMKAGKNKTTNSQQLWLQRLEQVGYAVAICYSAAAAITTIEEYLS